MKNILFILFFEFFFLQTYSQVNFEKAYFIDNNDVRTECFIKNKDLYNNPNTFEYKLNQQESIARIGVIKDVKEFGILNIIKFERNSVKMDTSSLSLDKLTEKREPEWKEKTLFLKVLIEGEASLYEFKENNRNIFFYKYNNLPIEQLIYKKYYLENTSNVDVAINNDFQKQLWTNLFYDTSTVASVSKLEYNRKDLLNYFVAYNHFKNSKIVNFGENVTKGSVNFKLKGGLTFSSLELSNKIASLQIDFANSFSYNFGSEMEYVLPFNRNKWSVFLGATYFYYQDEAEIKVINNSGVLYSNDIIHKWNASFGHLDMSFGLRHYMFINDSSKLFLSGAFVITKVLNSNVHDDNQSNPYYLKTDFGNSLDIGIGFTYKNKFNIEIRRSSPNIFANYVYWNSNFTMTSLVFGYSIFDSKNKSNKK